MKRLESYLTNTIAILVLAGLVSHSWAFAEENIHIISSANSNQFSETIDAFKQAVMQKHKGIHFKQTLVHKNLEQSKTIELELSKTDLIFTLGSPATKLVLSKQQSVPVVSALILSEDLLAQSNHATGIVLRYPMSIQLKWMKKVLPDVKRVGILYSPDKNSKLIAEAKTQAIKMQLQIVAIAVNNPRNLPAAMDDLYRRSDVLMAIPDSAIYSGKTLKQIMLSSFRNRVPLIGLSRNWVKAGAIYAIEGDFKSIGWQSAELAESIMINKRMPDSGFYFPNQVNLIINEKTMRHMRRDIDSHVLDSAAQIYR